MTKLFSIISDHFNSYTTPLGLKTRDGLPFWQEKILLYLMYVFMLFVPIAYFPSVVLAVKVDLWSIAIVDTIGYGFLIYLFANKKLSVNFRVYSLLIISYSLGVILLLTVGPFGAGYLWLFVVPILASVFLELKVAVFSLILNLITLIVLGVVYSNGLAGKSVLSSFQIDSWAVISANFMFLNLFSSIAVIFIIRGLEKSLRNEKSVTESHIKKSEELEAAKVEAERLNLIKSNFLAQMSHEVRSPISTIMNYMSLIKEKVEALNDSEIEDYFSSIKRGSKRIYRTIDMILNMSEIQSGTYKAEIEKINLESEVIKPLFDEFEKIAELKNINLSMKNLLNSSGIINADMYSVTQIFVNLFDNAVKYTQQGNIFIVLSETDEYIIVEIIDTGIGMSEDYLEELFEPFTQEESGYTRNYEGSGLGLALVRNYCKINNAEIQVESEKGKGTKFTVSFPI